MRVHIKYFELIRATESKSFCFHLFQKADNSLVKETASAIKYNELLAEHTMRRKRDIYCSNFSLETIFTMNTENSKTNQQRKFLFNLSQRLD